MGAVGFCAKLKQLDLADLAFGMFAKAAVFQTDTKSTSITTVQNGTENTQPGSWSAFDRQTSCAEPSPWEPTSRMGHGRAARNVAVIASLREAAAPLPPVMYFFLSFPATMHSGGHTLLHQTDDRNL